MQEILQLRAGDSNQPENGSGHDESVMAFTLAVWEATRIQPRLLAQRPRTRNTQTGRLLSF